VTHHDPLWSSPAYPSIAYLIALTGSALGLSCARRLQVMGLSLGRSWLLAGALSLGTGIWGMHFVAMLGYRVGGAEVRYDPVLTFLSWLVALAFVGIGMLLVSRNSSWAALLGSGLLAGVGIAGMHYLGMAAIRMPGHMHYDVGVVTLSVLIAVAAATAALWATLRLASRLARFVAALVMGVAISGMHYTGMMSAESMGVDQGGEATGGVAQSAVLVPLTVGLTMVILVVAFGVLMNPVNDLVKDLGHRRTA